MSYQYQSGAQKRKRAQQEKEFLSNYSKRSSIFNWIRPNSVPAKVDDQSSASSQAEVPNTLSHSADGSSSSSCNVEVENVVSSGSTGAAENLHSSASNTVEVASLGLQLETSEIIAENSTLLVEIESDSSGDELSSTNISQKQTQEATELLSNISSSNTLTYDIGKFDENIISENDIKFCLLNTHFPFPLALPPDQRGYKISKNIQSVTLANGEKVKRTYLVWSPIKSALYCLSCRLFNKKDVIHKSSLASPEGYSTQKSFKKLHSKLVEHENSPSHVECFLQMNATTKRLSCQNSIDFQLEHQLSKQVEKWKNILQRILHVVMFLGERGLAFRGSVEHIGDSRNGNFLGLLELVAEYDALLMSHLTEVKLSQQKGVRMGAHYLSPQSQNEFIDACGKLVQQKIIAQVLKAKYYSIIVDATPDSAHIEQTTFLLRFVSKVDGIWEVQERFLVFADCNKKKGIDIAKLILKTIYDFGLSISDCRGQGYDNGSNMAGRYNGCQAHILKENSTALYVPCATHSLNLCGVNAVSCCRRVITYFGVLQKIYNLFSASPGRWEILKGCLAGVSVHSLSQTRWSARIDAVKAFAKNLKGIKSALIALQEEDNVYMPVELVPDVDGLLHYMESYECVLLSSMWLKTLKMINEVNIILQARKATLDVVNKNLKNLTENLQKLRDAFETFYAECHVVANALEIAPDLPIERGKTPAFSPKQKFKIEVYNISLDTVISQVKQRYEVVTKVEETFNVLQKFDELEITDISDKCSALAEAYPNDLHAESLLAELVCLKNVYTANFDKDDKRSPLQLLNKISGLNMASVFPYICIACRMFCTLPVTVASAERSFSVMARVKNVLRSTMGQERLGNLGVLAVESEIARSLDYSEIIAYFAQKKARKVPLIH